jgi:hypothetical protein
VRIGTAIFGERHPGADTDTLEAEG